MRARHLFAATAFACGALGGATPPAPLAHEWTLIDGKYWQIAGSAGEDTATTDAREGNRGACTAGMIEVKGKYRVSQMGDELQKTR